jgi:hypothetical protein
LPSEREAITSRRRQRLAALTQTGRFSGVHDWPVLGVHRGIESVFSGMARAIIHNGDYASVEDAQAAITRHFAECGVPRCTAQGRSSNLGEGASTERVSRHQQSQGSQVSLIWGSSLRFR